MASSLSRAMKLLVLFLCLLEVSAFAPLANTCSRVTRSAQLKRDDGTALNLGNIFDDIQNFFSEFGESGKDERNDQAEDSENEDRIVSIPVRAMKPGGLRLFLMFYLMGMQNTPDRNSWKADQPSTDEYVIDFFFHDRSAMLTIELLDDKITIDRIGSTPSTAYVMQETVILEGILDELHQCAFDENIDEENRLLQLCDPKDAIEVARDALAFG